MSKYGGSVVQKDWQSTAEGETLLQQFYNAKAAGRKLFGILERPALFSGVEEVSYKLAFIGRSGSGKTTTIARFAGVSLGPTAVETNGIRITDVYWPVKVWDKVILFKLQCWDAGSASIKKFSHICQSCLDGADLRVFMFSYNDAASFADLPSLMKVSRFKNHNQPASVVIGTKNSMKTDVSPAEINSFELNTRIQVLKMPLNSSSGVNETVRMAPVLNAICELLWLRDQQYIMNQSVTV